MLLSLGLQTLTWTLSIVLGSSGTGLYPPAEAALSGSSLGFVDYGYAEDSDLEDMDMIERDGHDQANVSETPPIVEGLATPVFPKVESSVRLHRFPSISRFLAQ